MIIKKIGSPSTHALAWVLLTVVSANAKSAANDFTAKPIREIVALNCPQASSNVEKYICEKPALLKLDSQLVAVYKDDLEKSTMRRKESLAAEQDHWIVHTRGRCQTETCFKQAYWSRLAELETFDTSKPPLLKHESEKANEIKKLLKAHDFFEALLSRPKFCRQALADLKAMRGIQFVDPIVQTESYESPALDSTKDSCKGDEPLNFSYWCQNNISPDDKETTLASCDTGYGLPPFKIFELPDPGTRKGKRYIFYSDSAFGPMNRDTQNPSLGGGFSGFHQIDMNHCDELIDARFAQTLSNPENGKNFNSIIKYKNQNHFLILEPRSTDSSYWLGIHPIGKKDVCEWSSTKINFLNSKER